MKRVPRVVWLVVSVALPFGFAALLYPGLPERVPVHFGADGRPDGWGDRNSIFLGPLILGVVSLFVYFLLTNLGRIDPKRRTPDDEGVMKDFALFLCAFLSSLSFCILASTAWPGLPVIRLMLGVLGLGFFGMGRYMPRLAPNYFTGFRLPWTLEDPGNWASTHRFAGRIWSWGGVCIVMGALLLDGSWLWAVFTVTMSVMVIAPMVHSWRRFKESV